MRPGEFITADTHFGHRAMLKFADRPFESVRHMDEELIRRWNNKVPAGAVVYHLGDVSFYDNDRTLELICQLNGTMRIIRGNHDKKSTARALSTRAEWVRDYYESKTETGLKVVMCHYAMLTWNTGHYGSWMLHGHSHGTLHDSGVNRRIDVGVDLAPNYEPWSFDEINMRMAGRSFEPVDHHTGGHK